MPTGITTLLAVLSGSAVGFSLGLVGGGGSILATPLLLYVVGVTPAHTAIGTSALAVAVNAYINFASHARRGNVRWRSAVVFALGGVIGALVGSTLGKALNGDRLLFLFGLLMVVVGALMLRRKHGADSAERPNSLKSDGIVGVVSLMAGTASGFFGIGGGFLIVPGLILATGMPMINAVGSSLLAVGTFGTVTALNYAWSGLIDWSIAAEFIAGGAIGGLIGMRLACNLSTQKGVLNRVFAGLIFIVAAYVLYRSGQNIWG